MDHDLEEVRVSRYQQGSDGLGTLSRLLIFDQAVVLIGDPVLEIQQGAIRLIPNRIALPPLPNRSQV
jgi:hypothetical protein